MHFEKHERPPAWLSALGAHVKPVMVPHYSKFSTIHPETNIRLTGVPDWILDSTEGSYFIVDYKTAKFSGTQDKLLPVYEAQLNAYAYIAERVGFKPVRGLGVVYFEPVTAISVDDLDSFTLEDGFSMHFSGRFLQVEVKPDSIPPLLKRVRHIYDLPQRPKGVEGCRDCQHMVVMSNLDPMSKLIEHGHEERSLEYKQSAPWDELKLKIAKTAMGMANIRGGGTIVIGEAKKDGGYVPEGMLEEDLATYGEDEVQAYVNRFADPYVRTELQQVKWNEKTFLAVVVHEFDELPVICKRDCSPSMRQGAIYTRSYRMPETCEVRSQSEMREIVEMAVEKGMLSFVESHRSSLSGGPLDKKSS